MQSENIKAQQLSIIIKGGKKSRFQKNEGEYTCPG